MPPCPEKLRPRANTAVSKTAAMPPRGEANHRDAQHPGCCHTSILSVGPFGNSGAAINHEAAQRPMHCLEMPAQRMSFCDFDRRVMEFRARVVGPYGFAALGPHHSSRGISLSRDSARSTLSQSGQHDAPVRDIHGRVVAAITTPASTVCPPRPLSP